MGCRPGGVVSHLWVMIILVKRVKIDAMSTTEDQTTWVPFSPNTLGATSSGDEPYPELLEDSFSRTYFAGTSRRIRPLTEVIKAILLVIVILVAAVVVTHSVEARVCETSVSKSVACQGR